jgi:hypothetical protein
MSRRGISTVVDAVLFLLLVSTAIVTITLPSDVHTAPDAGESAQLLATTTASVEYELGSGTSAPTRTAHGTLAALAARAAIADARVGSRPLSPASEGFVRAVREQIRERLGPRTQVHAQWRPHESALVRGSVEIGRQPPPTADVSARVLSVPVGSGSAARPITPLPADTGVSSAIAQRLTARLLPATSAEVPHVDGPVRQDIRRRYRLLAGDRAATVTELFESHNVSAATAVTGTALAERIRADIRREVDSSAAAARAVETGTVTVTVRRWAR